jgi:hypothetical protein
MMMDTRRGKEEEDDQELCTKYRGHCDHAGLRAPADAQFLMTRGSMMCLESGESSRVESNHEPHWKLVNPLLRSTS